MKDKSITPLPKIAQPAELLMRLDAKRRAAIDLLKTHAGTKRKKKWVGIAEPVKRKRLRSKPTIKFQRKVNER